MAKVRETLLTRHINERLRYFKNILSSNFGIIPIKISNSSGMLQLTKAKECDCISEIPHVLAKLLEKLR